MPKAVILKVNGSEIRVPPGTSVASAVALAHEVFLRRSITGEPRGALCGMGICFECRATVDGRPQRRTCRILCRDEMEVVTDD